jgi:uncharacterized protein YjiS (DUF1127 family)
MSTLSLPSAKQIKVVELTSTALESLVAVWKAYVAWRARSAAKNTLCQLDDRTLKDIGLHRSKIDSAVILARATGSRADTYVASCSELLCVRYAERT